jgi:hypothetical protein
MNASRGRGATLVVLAALWTYLAVVLLHGARLGDAPLRTRYWILILLAGYAALPVAVSLLRRWLGTERVGDLAAAAGSVLASLLLADFAYTVVENARRPQSQFEAMAYARTGDAHVWHGELFPRVYFPTDRDFVLYKPRVRLGADTYGEFYSTQMLRSPTLADSVLHLRHVDYEIDRHGFRNSRPLSEARTFALGDSFVFGYGTDAADIWTEVLSRSLGESVYNLGVSATGPRTQLMSLEYLIESERDSVDIDRLVWMIFEGNDLENSYLVRRPGPLGSKPGLEDLLRGTIVDGLATLPVLIRDHSLVYKIRTGRVVLGSSRPGGAEGAYEVDGVELAFPLFHSSRWGYRLFNPRDIERATQPGSYVDGHPNRPALDATFRDMRSLSERLGFCVTVAIAPSASRLHGAQFEGFPKLSLRSHFADYVRELAHEQGFRVANLVEEMAPYADEELLYYRDDHHWNPRGNALAGELVREALASGCGTGGS